VRFKITRKIKDLRVIFQVTSWLYLDKYDKNKRLN